MDARGELADEPHIIDALVSEVRRVVIEAETDVAFDRLDGPLGRRRVEGDLRRVHLQREVDVFLFEHFQDGQPAAREIIEASLPVLLAGRRERVGGVPDARAREATYRIHTELARGPGGELHLLGGALAHTLGIAVAPDVFRQYLAVSGVDRVADCLADQVIRYRPAVQAVAGQEYAQQ